MNLTKLEFDDTTRLLCSVLLVIGIMVGQIRSRSIERNLRHARRHLANAVDIPDAVLCRAGGRIATLLRLDKGQSRGDMLAEDEVLHTGD